MALKISWTENALADYKQVLDYLHDEWPVSVTTAFINNFQSRIETLLAFPDIGIASSKITGVKSIVLTKHNKLYYRVTDEQLYILNIFDTRQDPEKNKYE